MPLYVPPPEQYHFEVVEVAMADPEMDMSKVGGTASVFSTLSLTPIESHSVHTKTKTPTSRDRQIAQIRQKLGLDAKEIVEPGVHVHVADDVQEMFDGLISDNEYWGEVRPRRGYKVMSALMAAEADYHGRVGADLAEREKPSVSCILT
jgi:hypothetical protein